MKQDTRISYLNTFPNHYNWNHLQIRYNIPGFLSLKKKKKKNGHIEKNAYAHPVAVASIEIQPMKLVEV